MPLFSRNRPASDAPPHLSDVHTSPRKRLSVDSPTAPSNGDPPTTPSRLKALLQKGRSTVNLGNTDEPVPKRKTSGPNFFRRRSSNASSDPSRRGPAQSTEPVTPPRTPHTGSSGAAMARYADSAPRHSSQFTSPTLFPENFTLSSTISPEAQHVDSIDSSPGLGASSPPNRSARQSWQPSYPLVVPDDSYADVPPDGHGTPAAESSVIASAAGNENAKRRSMDAQKLEGWRPLEPEKKESAPQAESAPSIGQNEVPPYAPSSELVTPPSSEPQLSGSTPAPLKSLASTGEPQGSRPSTASTQKTATSLATIHADGQYQFVPSATSSPRISTQNIYPSPAATPSAPSSPSSTFRARPGPPPRKITIHSPPMPQPIKNLPTLTNLSSVANGSAAPEMTVPTPVQTPGWGELAKEGGPKTPGSGLRSPGWTGAWNMPKTPGLGAFSLNLPPPGKDKRSERQELSEQELRKARRAMPVMLRQPSSAPSAEDDEGGEAGDDDEEEDDGSDEEADEEADADEGDSDNDSDYETDRPSGSAMGLGRLVGKGKGKEKGKASRKISHTQVGDVAKSPNGKSVWSLATPAKEKDQSTAWASFGGETPKGAPATPGWGWKPTELEEGSPITRTGSAQPTATATAAARAALTRDVSSYATSFSTSVTSSGYFDSQPSSSGPSQMPSPSPAERQQEPLPILDKGKGKALLPSDSGLAPGLPIGLGVPVGTTATVDDPPVVNRESSADDEDDEVISVIEEESDEEDGRGTTSEGTNEVDTPSVEAVEPSSTGLAARPSIPSRPSLYTQGSISMIDLPSRPKDTANTSAPQVSVKPSLRTVQSGEAVPLHIDLPPPNAGPSGLMSPAEWAKPPPTPALGIDRFNLGVKPSKPLAAKRRRSADDLSAPPPKYEPPFPGTFIPKPRDEEGQELLPKYWCSVHIEGMLQRKMEFVGERDLSTEGTDGKRKVEKIQARDRSWKKLYFILHGTALLVYKFDPHRFPLRANDQSPVPTIDDEEMDEHLHVHPTPERRRRASSVGGSSVGGRRSSNATIGGDSGRRGSADSTNGSIIPRRGSGESNSASSIGLPIPGRRGSESNNLGSGSYRRSSLSIVTNANGSSSNVSEEKDANMFTGSTRRGSMSQGNAPNLSSSQSSIGTGNPLSSHFQHNALVKQYSLNKTESGLAADYHKRKNVVRVRADGEQFLLQTESARDMVDWVEAFQAATNVAKDLDQRPMPKIITLPRRRRRRNQQAQAAAAAAAAAVQANGPQGEGQAVDAALRVSRQVAASDLADRERERMLMEDQEAAVS
ncbi:hypothetical protein L198_02281 [Cryptococcus wingfieldii CBS 7118]|uniref:PH domain-containing protein n=1 Tax=Cryptococcus wingfieldii CBS 7118 TaxID=1295528 RepID=A0A1E3JRE5_9TREE|nr:hypothetical protein L198_02281 [Cryptococcus wingfieldii CBS 7118]ODO03434.1 hypothetical protein L198_02281 [Cryptococcus wingfieldii CBS 7118]